MIVHPKYVLFLTILNLEKIKKFIKKDTTLISIDRFDENIKYFEEIFTKVLNRCKRYCQI